MIAEKILFVLDFVILCSNYVCGRHMMLLFRAGSQTNFGHH